MIPRAVQLCEDRRSSIPVGAPSARLALFYCIPHSIPLSTLLNSCRCSIAMIDTLPFHSALSSPPLSAPLNSHRHTLVWIVISILNSALLTPTPPPPFRHSSASTGTPQSLSALLSLDLALFFILHSFNTFCVLLFSTQHSPSGAPHFLGGCSPFSSE